LVSLVALTAPGAALAQEETTLPEVRVIAPTPVPASPRRPPRPTPAPQPGPARRPAAPREQRIEGHRAIQLDERGRGIARR